MKLLELLEHMKEPYKVTVTGETESGKPIDFSFSVGLGLPGTDVQEVACIKAINKMNHKVVCVKKTPGSFLPNILVQVCVKKAPDSFMPNILVN